MFVKLLLLHNVAGPAGQNDFVAAVKEVLEAHPAAEVLFTSPTGSHLAALVVDRFLDE